MKRAAAPTGSVTTALIYTRVSSDEQAREGLSLDARLAECRRYAAGMGWVLGREYQDVLSGKRDDRPQYQALLAEVRRLRGEMAPAVVVVAAARSDNGTCSENSLTTWYPSRLAIDGCA